MDDKVREELRLLFEKYSSTGAYGTCIWFGSNGENWQNLINELFSKLKGLGYFHLDLSKLKVIGDGEVMKLIDISPVIYHCGIFLTPEDLKKLLQAQLSADRAEIEKQMEEK